MQGTWHEHVPVKFHGGPEMFDPHCLLVKLQSQPYSWASDIWALGCVLFELCSLRVPFEAHNMKSLVTRIVDGRVSCEFLPSSTTRSLQPPPLPAQYSSELRGLYLKMLARSPSGRPTASQILHEPFIRRECAAMLSEEDLLAVGADKLSISLGCSFDPKKNLYAQEAKMAAAAQRLRFSSNRIGEKSPKKSRFWPLFWITSHMKKLFASVYKFRSPPPFLVK